MSLLTVIKKNTAGSIIALLAGIVVLIYSPYLLVMLVSLCFTYYLLGRKLTTPYVDTKLLLVVLSIFTYTGLVALVIIISSAMLNASLNIVLLITFVLLTAFYIYEVSIVRSKTPNRKKVGLEDSIALVVTIIAVFFIGLFPLLTSNVAQQHSNVLLTLTGNVDNGVHLAIYNDYIDSGSNRIWSESFLSRTDTGGFYPTSWHGANAAMVHAIYPKLQAGTQTIVTFSVLYIFWIGVLVFLTTKLCFSLFRGLNRSKNIAPITYLSISILMSLSVYFFTIHLLRFGFFSFIPQLLSVVLLFYCLQQVAKDGMNQKGVIGLSVVYIAISLASWILLLPVVVLALLIVASISPNRPNLKTVHQEFTGGLPYYSVALASILAQAWLIITVKSQGTVSFIQGLLLDGGTPIYDPLVYALLFGGLVGAVYIAKKQKELYRPILAIVMSTLVFCSFIFIVQAYYTGTSHYYFYKSLLILPVILVPTSVAAFAVFIQKTLKKDVILALFITLLVPLSILLFIPSDKGMVSYLRGSRSVSAQVNQYIMNETVNTPYPTNKVTIFLVGTNESSDVASLLVQANRPHNACFDDLRLKQIITKITQTAVKELDDYVLPLSCENYSVKFLVGNEYKDLLPVVSSNDFEIDLLPR